MVTDIKGIVCIEQRLTAGNKFTGVIPTTDVTKINDSAGLRIFDPLPQGGEFDFWAKAPSLGSAKKYITIERIVADLTHMGGGSTHEFKIATASKEILWMIGGPDAVVWSDTGKGLLLAYDEKLKLYTSANCTAEMYIRVFARPLANMWY